jgi:hypothetical protein
MWSWRISVQVAASHHTDVSAADITCREIQSPVSIEVGYDYVPGAGFHGIWHWVGKFDCIETCGVADR